MDTKTINLRDVPEDLVRRAKACAAIRGLSLKGFILEAVDRLVADTAHTIESSAFFAREHRGSEVRRKHRKQ